MTNKEVLKKSIKTFLLQTSVLSSLIFMVILFVLVSVMTTVIPTWDKIQKLKNGFVEVYYDSKKETIDYKIVGYRPDNWVKINNISTALKWSIVVSEDWAFFAHPGFDINQIQKAIEDSIDEKKVTRGASTISQQMVKNLFLSNEKTLTRKLKEFVITLMVEHELKKTKILEIYFNIIEFGRGIYGINQATNHYFKKTPMLINAKEGAFIAMLLPNPKKYSQSFRDKKLTEFATQSISSIMDKLVKARVLSEDERLFYDYQKLSFEQDSIEDTFFYEEELDENGSYQESELKVHSEEQEIIIDDSSEELRENLEQERNL